MKLKDFIEMTIKFGEDNPDLLDKHVAVYDHNYDEYDIFEEMYLQVVEDVRVHIRDQQEFNLHEKSNLLVLDGD